MKADKEFGPVMELVAGCPFTNFGKCKGEKCTFFVAVPPELTERECIIKAIYFQQLTMNVILQSASLNSLNNPDSLSTFSPVRRIVESLIDSLESLDGLVEHPKTGDKVKAETQKLKDVLAEGLHKFAGS